MATFYVGKRPVLKGRSGNVTNIFTGKVGVYSNWDLMNPSHVLDGAPDNYHVPGTGYSPGDVQLSRELRGLEDPATYPLYNPGNSPRQDSFYFRQKPDLWKGVPAGNAFASGYGHILDGGPMADYATWTNYFYAGVPAGRVMDSAHLGHKQEAYGSHYAFFGPTKPYEFHGVATNKSEPMLRTGHGVYAPSVVADHMPADYGQIPATRSTTEHYGFEHVQEWFGVPSAKAL